MFKLLGAQPGIELSVFAGPGEGSLESAGGEEHFLHVRAAISSYRVGRAQMYYQRAQIEVVDPERFDLVILPWNTRLLTLGAGLRRARRRELPIALWGHGYSKRQRRPMRWLRNRMARMADAVLLYSHGVARRLIEEFGFDPRCVFVAQNALDQAQIKEAVRRWTSDPKALPTFQRKHDVDPAQTVIFVSRLEPQNRVEMLIRGMQCLQRSRPAAKMVIVGQGSQRSALETLAAELGQADRVIFTGAIYEESQLAPWMLSATLFCYPVNIGLSLLHAFGFGLPVVTSDDIPSHNPEIEALEPGVNGLLYRDGDVQHMVAQWLRLMDDPVMRDRLGANARRQVSENYSLAKMVQGFLDLTSIVDGERRVVQPIAQDLAANQSPEDCVS
ncbi:MAG: glycosyltransferase family 4 protein [Planctomycetes bacterium]|nr:glycosyltransferase family 4 protein [Planctomycetota bacterium]